MRVEGTIPAGLCQCGCGAPTRRHRQDSRNGKFKRGEWRMFVKGHFGRVQRKSPDDYVVDSESGCWIWQLSGTPAGYGKVQFWEDGKRITVMAHRFVYERERGPIPAGLHLDHLCRNRRCVNPDHLEPVTCAENLRRGDSGKHLRRLTENDVREIRRLYAEGQSKHELAERFGVTWGNIDHIVLRRTWKDVA